MLCIRLCADVECTHTHVRIQRVCNRPAVYLCALVPRVLLEMLLSLLLIHLASRYFDSLKQLFYIPQLLIVEHKS